MKLRISKYLFLLVMAVFALSSCSENDDSYDAYANWQERNEQAFADTLAYARKMGEANGWYVYKNWTFENQTPNKDQNGNLATLTYKDCDNIIVHVLKKGEGTTSPILTDSVQVSYRGRFIPTDNYKEGYVFDQSFTGTFDAATAKYPEINKLVKMLGIEPASQKQPDLLAAIEAYKTALNLEIQE